MSLFFNLLKTHTEIVQLKDMNEVMSNALGLFEPIDVEVFALKPKADFPTKLGDNTYLGYVCLSKVSNRDDIRMIQFYHENKGCEEIILPFLNMLVDELSPKDGSVVDYREMIIVPYVIRSERRMWIKYMKRYFEDIESGEKFFLKNKIPENVDWECLLQTLPKSKMEI
jgi:hypothetical protein